MKLKNFFFVKFLLQIYPEIYVSEEEEEKRGKESRRNFSVYSRLSP